MPQAIRTARVTTFTSEPGRLLVKAVPQLAVCRVSRRSLTPRAAVNRANSCAQHWHHKCWGADILLPDDERPDCPCRCGDPADPTGQRMSADAWADLAQQCPEVVPQAVQVQRIREGIGIHLCAVDDEERHRPFKEPR
jgi:hypothetical protein